jgi:hypothetical protein
MALETSEDTLRILAELARHPGWQLLWNKVERRKQKEIEMLGRKAFMEGGVPAEDAARVRGFHEGADWIRREADKAFRHVYEEHR